LAREKAALGDDAHQFATVEDGDLDDDLLGGASGGGEFESQFPDISTNNVRPLRARALPRTACRLTRRSRLPVAPASLVLP